MADSDRVTPAHCPRARHGVLTSRTRSATFVPSAYATRVSVSSVGFVFPPSTRLKCERCSPACTARSSAVMPVRLRSARMRAPVRAAGVRWSVWCMALCSRGPPVRVSADLPIVENAEGSASATLAMPFAGFWRLRATRRQGCGDKNSFRAHKLWITPVGAQNRAKSSPQVSGRNSGNKVENYNVVTTACCG